MLASQCLALASIFLVLALQELKHDSQRVALVSQLGSLKSPRRHPISQHFRSISQRLRSISLLSRGRELHGTWNGRTEAWPGLVGLGSQP
jgi:hypothetical protein